MIEKLIARVKRLEDAAVMPSEGRHLAFTIEGPRQMPEGAAVTFLRSCGHAIHDEDSVFIIEIPGRGERGHLYDLPLRDLTPELVTEEVRAKASPALSWPAGAPSPFTFNLDGPGAF